jgi:hypothetical protein
MNLFRSEEHVKNWSKYEPESEDGILPLADWARIFSEPLFRNRMQTDYLSQRGDNLAGLTRAFAEAGGDSEFWKPG